MILLALLQNADARGGYWYNHPDVEWHTLETEHFYFHWPESSRPEDDPHYFTTEFTASALAEIAETSYPAVCSQLDHFLEEKVHVVIYDQDRDWMGNGFAIAEYDWTGFAARWGPVFRERGRMEFLTDVFVHEFAHIVSLKAYLPYSEGSTFIELGGLAEDEEHLRRWGYQGSTNVNADLGVSWLHSVHTPFYWAEGGAEWWSHNADYNYWGSSRDAYLRMTVLEDRILTHDEWTTRIDKEGFDGERGYNQGYAFALYMRDRFGRDTYSEMAAASAERWHWEWDAVVEEVTGVPGPQLYEDFKAFLYEEYGKVGAEVEARGAVTGREIALVQPIWEREDTTEWDELNKVEQDAEMDGDSAWEDMPVWSPTGEHFAWFGPEGFTLVAAGPEDWPSMTGEYIDEEDDEALEAWEDKWYVDYWLRYSRPSFDAEGKRLVGIRSEDHVEGFRGEQGLTFNGDGYSWNQLVVGTIGEDKHGALEVTWEAVEAAPLRVVDAAFHPDGNRVFFIRYSDGSHNLWVHDLAAETSEQLTDFTDGTQLQGLSFNEDGSGLLTAVYRLHQQDPWIFEIETGEWWRVFDSRADETDPVFGPDDTIWFTSDLGGIFNVYSMSLATREVVKQTELFGGAYGVSAAPSGDIAFTAITGHGFKVRMLRKDELKGELVDYPGVCNIDPDACQADDEAMAYRPHEFLPDARDLSKPYKARNAMLPLAGWPVVRATDKNVEAGFGASFGDYSEAHYLDAMATFGKDNWVYLGYWNDVFWPSINIGWSRYIYKGHYGYGVDNDGIAATDDITVVDVKFEQMADDLWLYTSYTPSDAIWMGFGADVSRYSFRDTGDGPDYVPYIVSSGVGVFAEWSPQAVGYGWGDDWINPRGGRRVYVDYSHRWTQIVDPEVAGAIYDDGELFDRYSYNKVLLSYSEFIPVGWFGATDHHTLQIDLEGGYIDRNVLGWDELIAGGKHPYHWGSGTVGNNVQFSGYEGWSLYGETMIIANAAYRFPVARDLDLKTGPVYTETLYLQLFGSVGNLWSYRIDGPSHLEGYSVVPDEGSTVRREVPFKDYAAKNSPKDSPNYVLTDVGAELRIRQFIWNDWDWDSFVRVSYGLNPTAGYGDVNSDYISSSVARDASSELSDEIEDPTVRLYLGLGTGW